MEETLGNVGTYLDLSKYPGFLPQCLEELCVLQTSNGDFFFGFLFLQGVRDYSVPVGLDGKAQVDLVVVGSVAVSEKGEEKLPAEKSQVPVQCQEAEICPWSWAEVWVLSLCVTNPCSQPQQEAQRCSGFRKTLEASNSLCFKGIQSGSWSEICSVWKDMC